jgi:cell division protease FtsH
MNEAAIISARNGKSMIDNDSIEYAIDRVQVGIAKPIGPYIRKELVAYHEAGHALMAAFSEDYDNITKVTIVPRSNGAGGFTLFSPSEERTESGLYSQKYLKSQLAVALGGRVAEEIQFGEEEITTGASSDLQRVKQLARQMITQWGFKNSTNINDFPISWEPSPSQYNELSDNTQKYIDEEIKKIIKQAYEVCKKTLHENKNILDLIASELIEFETITGETVMKLINKAKSEV